MEWYTVAVHQVHQPFYIKIEAEKNQIYVIIIKFSLIIEKKM